MMKKALLILTAGLLSLGLQAQNCGPFDFPSYSPLDSATAKGWPQAIFKISQEYPAAQPSPSMPWDRINIQKDALKFSRSVLSYCLEGMEAADFVADANTVRKWYHGPWLHHGVYGREFLRGLRREGNAPSKTLAPTQATTANIYAQTFYNEAAAWTLGKIWCKPTEPDTSKLSFPNGAVIFKMLFTTAPTSEVPALANTLEWEANVVADASNPFAERKPAKVRLCGVDVALHTGSSSTSWVFLSYNFDGTAGATLADRLVTAGVQLEGHKVVDDSSKYVYYNAAQGKPFRTGLGRANPFYHTLLGWMNSRLAAKTSFPADAARLLDEAEGFDIDPNANQVKEEEEPAIEVPVGLTGSNLVKFLIFGVIILITVGLLVMNIMKKR